jgi:hypothetical protein
LKTKSIVILLVVLAVLGGVFYVVARPKPGPAPQAKDYVWLIEQENIDRVTMTLPRETPPLSQSFVRISQGDKFPWFFDDPQHSPVDAARWGGGIPLLLSGPGADRVIAQSATAEQLTVFGFDKPSMDILLELNTGNNIHIEVGDRTPDGNNFYVKAPSTNAVATVDYTWYTVLEKIIRDPPYAAPATTTAKP